MHEKLPKSLKEALDKAKENADKDGYFEVNEDANSFKMYKVLESNGYVEQRSNRTGLGLPVCFRLGNKAYSYDDYEAENNMRTENTIKESGDNMVTSNKVFIVHGHDDEAILKIENFIRKIGLDPIILRDQASMGKTIIEKIEEYANVGFAIVLYTRCDEMKDGKFRARQNVVFEHGYLIGKLKRNRVVALVKDEVEVPGDISGVVYISLDPNDGWKLKLIKELQAAGYEIDAKKL